MKKFKRTSGCILIILAIVIFFQGCTEQPVAMIYIDKNAYKTVDLAAREVRKYIYQRTGELLPVAICNILWF